MSKTKKIFVAVLVIGLFLFAAREDYEIEDQNYQEYCQMVMLWKEDQALPPGQRRGWPPYKGECR